MPFWTFDSQGNAIPSLRVDEEPLPLPEGQSYCSTCMEAVPTETLRTNAYGELVCDVCYRRARAACWRCGTEHFRDSMSWVCDGNDSGELHRWCQACLNVARENCDVVWCDSCEQYEYGPVAHVENLDDDDDAYVSLPGWVSRAHDWKPEPKFYGKDPAGLFFGWELETELVDVDRDSVPRPPDWLYAKVDGSLARGIEYVSHPMSWAWIKSHRDELAQWMNRLRRLGCRSYNTPSCGMHVHLSRKAFTPLHQLKFLKLIYENPALTTAISQRELANLRTWASLRTENDDGDRITLARKVLNKYNAHDNRYHAVNMENDATLEVRIFRGTLKPAGFFRNLEFCRAAWDYTRDIRPADVTVSGFAEYVHRARKEYPHLLEFLRERECEDTCV